MTETQDNTEILFYCRSCKMVSRNAERQGKKYEYICPHCKSTDVAFGTSTAISEFFHIKEAALAKMLETKPQ